MLWPHWAKCKIGLRCYLHLWWNVICVHFKACRVMCWIIFCIGIFFFFSSPFPNPDPWPEIVNNAALPASLPGLLRALPFTNRWSSYDDHQINILSYDQYHSIIYLVELFKCSYTTRRFPLDRNTGICHSWILSFRGQRYSLGWRLQPHWCLHILVSLLSRGVGVVRAAWGFNSSIVLPASPSQVRL